MTNSTYDLVIIGAGTAGKTAALFAAQLGAKVALVEKYRVGGDCTWMGCVPSKALLKAARIAHESRQAARYGIITQPPRADMVKVRSYVHDAIRTVYQFETPDELLHSGVRVTLALARFLDANTIQAGGLVLKSKKFLIATGAGPFVPPVAGLNEVPYITYERLFDNDRLPRAMVVIGAGPIGMEMAQAYQRLGAQVTVVGERLLPKEEPEVQEVMRKVFEGEGIKFVWGRATAARKEGDEIVITCDSGEARGELLLVASGRRPTVEGLDLEKAGVRYTDKGIPVDDKLRTNVKHIYAAGDVAGGHQFTHFAGWQGFQAARNALLPGSSSGFTETVPWVTFTDPEVAHVGLTEAEAREKLGDRIRIDRWGMNRTDRAVCENDTSGFIKVVSRKNGKVLGATIVAGRAGEAITEFAVAIKNGLKVMHLAETIHAYPTYSTAVQQLAVEISVDNLLSGRTGRIIRGLSKILR